MRCELFQADAAALPLAADSVDFVLGSPPYLDARTYGIGAQRHCRQWIDWMMEVTRQAVRVCRGVVVWVCAGVTRRWNYQPGPEGLLYEWWKAGGISRRPVYWRRVGIPGSGGKDWFRADMEYCLAFAKTAGLLAWSDNTAMGHPPRWSPGGAAYHRLRKGAVVNQWSFVGSGRGRRADGTPKPAGSPSHVEMVVGGGVKAMMRAPNGYTKDRDLAAYRLGKVPVLANPGNLILTNTGGGAMGSKLAHENEAPYPEALAEWWIRSMCPPGGTVLDPFCGSGTTAATAMKLGRSAIGCDIRRNQIELARRRVQECAGLFVFPAFAPGKE